MSQIFLLVPRYICEGSKCSLELHVFTVHHGYILSLEKEKNCMEKVLNFAYKNVYKPCTQDKVAVTLKMNIVSHIPCECRDQYFLACGA